MRPSGRGWRRGRRALGPLVCAAGFVLATGSANAATGGGAGGDSVENWALLARGIAGPLKHPDLNALMDELDLGSECS